MDTIKIEKKNTRLIAHRGVSGIEVENTIPSFSLAGKKTYYGIETDIHVTKDNKFIVCHDDNIVNVTNIDMVIEDSLFDDLRKIKVVNKPNAYSGDMFLPTLDEYITICKNSGKKAILELKNTMSRDNIIDIVNSIKDIGYFYDTTFISFSEFNIAVLKEEFENSNCQFLGVVDSANKEKELIDVALKYHVDLDLYYEGIRKEFVDLCHNKNILINIWTVDDYKIAAKLISYNVDFITTNILE